VNRVLLCVCIALAFFVYRSNRPVVVPAPVPVVDSAAIPALKKYRDQMTAAERSAFSEAYSILSRAVAANPADEPVIETTAALVEVHRAAVLFVYKGVLGGETGKYPGLAGELEGLVRQAVGSADVPLNPAVQRAAADTFASISLSLR
jgi:hypothetical protein